MRILFSRDVNAVIADGGTFKKGSVYDVPLNDAMPFISNGFAVPEKEGFKIADPVQATVKVDEPVKGKRRKRK